MSICGTYLIGATVERRSVIVFLLNSSDVQLNVELDKVRPDGQKKRQTADDEDDDDDDEEEDRVQPDVGDDQLSHYAQHRSQQTSRACDHTEKDTIL